MDDDKLAKEYIEFVKSVNSDWTIPDVELDFPNVTYAFDGYDTPKKKRKRWKSPTKAIVGGNVSGSNKKGKPLCRA